MSFPKYLLEFVANLKNNCFSMILGRLSCLVFERHLISVATRRMLMSRKLPFWNKILTQESGSKDKP